VENLLVEEALNLAVVAGLDLTGFDSCRKSIGLTYISLPDSIPTRNVREQVWAFRHDHAGELLGQEERLCRQTAGS
jgi:hypothetical protein